MITKYFTVTITWGRAFLKTDAGIAIILAILWQLIFTIIGAFFDSTLFNIFQKEGAEHTNMALLSHTMSWDANWYASIVNGAYNDVTSPAAAFYPLFPAIIQLLNFVTFGFIDLATLGLIVNTACLTIAIYALKKIAEHFLPKKYHWWPVVLFLTSPAAIFMHAFYTEALFCALAFLAYMFALQRRWLAVGILLALLTATRLPSILFLGLCGLEFMRAYKWKIKKIFNKNLLYFLLAPLGFITYGLFLLLVRGDFFGMFSAYSLSDDWTYQQFNPNIFKTYYEIIQQLFTVFTTAIPFDEGQFVNLFIPIVGLLLLFASSLYLLRKWKGPGLPLAIFGLVTIIFVSLNSNLISIHRYMLPCLGIYLAIALFCSKTASRKYLLYGVLYAGVLLQAYLLILFVSGYFAG